MPGMGVVLAVGRKCGDGNNVDIKEFYFSRSSKFRFIIEDALYKPGDMVKGAVIITEKKKVPLLAFKLNLTGTVNLEFKENEVLHSTKSRNFLSVTAAVCGIGLKSEILAPGKDENCFPFAIKLPEQDELKKEDFVSSLRTSFGHVNYALTAFILMEEKTGCVQKSQQNIPFRVRSNLSDIADIWNEPVRLERTASKRELRNKMGFTMQLPKTGFIVGEEFGFGLKLVNVDEKKIAKMVVKLMQKLTYQTDTASKSTNKILSSTEEFTSIDNGAELVGMLQVPSNARASHKGIIACRHAITVEIFTSDKTSTPEIFGAVSIVIGTSVSDATDEEGSAGGSGQNQLTLPSAPMLPDYSRRASSASLLRPSAPFDPENSSRPPRYSMLSIRTKSASLETLPPSFDEAVKVTD